MKLAGYTSSPTAISDIQDLRDLTAEELKQHALFKPVVAEAKNRLALFRILDANFRQWTECLQSLLHPGAMDEDTVVLNLERLLLNYLTCAHHLRTHFESSFQQRFRTDSSEQKKYKMQLDALTQTSWPFAFFLDFRNYVQNQGLGLGFFKRKLTPTSVSIELTLNAAELLNTTKDWPRSKLAPAKGIMELVPLLRDFHAQMMQKYSALVIATLFADLPPAAEFYKKLAAEVAQKSPGLTMGFNDHGKMVSVPNDLFAELGLAGVARK
ncbi:MAG TPA: hypothetical protein VK737_00325 [Opitutales bacterium]|jgi:hypothetical protein|nr:hypothetical protein [Opitutales bacterium]